jgi:hypothetical protein
MGDTVFMRINSAKVIIMVTFAELMPYKDTAHIQ